MNQTTLSERALVLTPRGRDAELASDLLRQAGFTADICASVSALVSSLSAGAAFVVLTEEALSTSDLHTLSRWLVDQEGWSDLPFVLLTRRGGGLERNPAASRYLELLGNVTFLERPFHPTTLISFARSALRGRRRQYEARRRLEQLSEGQARFRAAVEAVQGVVWTNDAQGQMLGEQPGWSALTGQTRQEYEGFGWAAAVHPEDAEPTINAWNDAVKQHKPFMFEHRVRRRNGDWGHFSIRAVPVRDATGQISEWVGVHTDVTEARLAERALREETRTLETLNRTGVAIAAELDIERLVQLVTDAGVELIGARFGAFFYNIITEAGERLLLYALAGADRSSFEKFGMPRPTPVFKPTFMGEGVVRSDDILTDQRYGKNAPHHGMPKGHLPVRSYLAVPVTSRSGEVLGGLFFGHPAPARFNERHEHLISGIAGQAAVAIDNARLYRALQRANETLEKRVAEEIEKRASAEDALRQAQKMEAIGQLTGGVAHDFNNLLTIIKSSTDLLRRPDLGEERRRRYVDAISSTVDRASKLTSQLLAFARRQALKPELFDVSDRVKHVVDMLQAVVGSPIIIETDIDCEECFVESDVSQFETALVNVTVNARDSMEGGGTLAIKVRAVDEMPSLRGNAPAHGGFVAISLQDTGVGIPDHLMPHIFEPFFTTKEVGKGTGLGLSQVYGFAKQSGGDVTVESGVDIGTKITIYLPRVAPAIVPPPHSDDYRQQSSEFTGRGCRVLVVEDNTEVGAFSTQLLKDLGYQTTWATNGEEALMLLRGGEDFDVVFSDVVMPGMGGVDLAREVRRLYPGLPVVLTSGYSHVLAQEGNHGFDLLQKPYAVEQLSRILRKVTRGRGTREPGRASRLLD